jgi:hypothetical protein
VTWLKVTVDNLPADARVLALYGIRLKTDGTIAVYINGRLVAPRPAERAAMEQHPHAALDHIGQRPRHTTGA